MLIASACFFALGTVSPIEVTVFDPHRRLAWTPAGKPLDYKTTLPKSVFDGNLIEQMGAKEQDRIVLLRVPWTRDEIPTVVVQFPNGGRIHASTVLLSRSPRKSWIVPIKVSLPAFEHTEGSFEFGIANGPWKTTGTQWMRTKRVRGEAFNIRLAPSKKTSSSAPGGAKHWTLTSTLSRTPRHLAWRLLPYDAHDRPMGSAGSIKVPNRDAWAYYFEARNAKSEVARIDLQRRPLEWTKFFGNFALNPVNQ